MSEERFQEASFQLDVDFDLAEFGGGLEQARGWVLDVVSERLMLSRGVESVGMTVLRHGEAR